MALRDPDFLVRAYSANSLTEAVIERTDPDRRKVVSALTTALEDHSPEVRLSAGVALAKLGEGKTALPALINGALRSERTGSPTRDLVSPIDLVT